MAGKDNTIATINGWLEGNESLLEAALTERSNIETKLDSQKSGLPGIQSNFTSVLNVLAALNRTKFVPSLDVLTIAEDDPIRNTGIMVLGILPAGHSVGPNYQKGTDLIARYKATISYNGIPVTPTYLLLQAVKRTVYNPSSKQFTKETLASELTDASADFVMVIRPVTPGVVELDVYYTGPLDSDHVAQYTLVITAGMRLGTTYVWGTSLQSLCMLGWSMDPTYVPLTTTLPDGSTYYGWVNPLGTFTSCDEIVFWQRIWLGLPVPQG